MPLEHLRSDRHRAVGFGSIAERYDRFRSGYPDELIDDLVSTRPNFVLDVGSGTGKVAVALDQRGIRVLGVEPDPRMAAVARRRGVLVEIATFETWLNQGRQFDMITCGHAWHWIDPEAGIEKTSKLLNPGGTIARFWNYHAIDATLLTEFEAVYHEHAPALQVIGRDPSGSTDHDDPFDAHPAFGNTRRRTYRWTRNLSAADWAALIATFGDHQRLGETKLSALQEALIGTIDKQGGDVTVRGGTYALFAQRNR